MRALVCNQYGPPEKLRIEEQDDPVPRKGQVLVNIKAAAIS
jgi:NADPH2:quinone reductase